MKKILNLMLCILTSILLIGCVVPEKVTYNVDFVDRNMNTLASLTVNEGENINEYPYVEVEEGYYYEWNMTLEELQNITSDMIVEGLKKEYYKNVKYFIDDELFYEFEGLYTKNYKLPEMSTVYETYDWEESKKELVDNTYYIEYKLKYTVKQTYNIYYYDGDTKLDLSPATYNINQTTTLPEPTKEGYAFVGWFPSSISLKMYKEIGEGFNGNITLYARFVEVEKQNLLTLLDTPYHFSEIKKNYNETTKVSTYNPVMPSGVVSSVTQYDWTTSDSSIATVSAYSSITIKNGGYCVLTATLKTDPNVIINAVIRTSVEGISVSTVEEANTIITHTVKFVGKDNELIDTQTVVDGQYAIAPTPLSYEGLAFNGWDKNLFNIKADTTIKATYVNGENKYEGKNFSFIGDSISTYQDYVPEGYATFYPYPTADVTDVNLTWWMQVCNKIGASMYINNSYSGSCVATSGSSSSSNVDRLKELVVNEKSADVIIIFMGNNDANPNSGITDSLFNERYRMMIDYIYDLCGEDVEIILCTLPTSKLYTEARKTSFNAIIEKIANDYKLDVVDFASMDLIPHLVDSAHPETSGMTAMANKVVEELLKK